MQINTEWRSTVARYLAEGRTVSGACGASSSENQIEKLQQEQYQTSIDQSKQIFGDGSKIFNELSSSFSPILAAGPNQQGYNPTEMATLNSQAATSVGQTAAMQKQALNSTIAAQGGANALPSGVALKAASGVATGAGQNLANAELGIQEQSQELGHSNWLDAANVLGGATGVFNPATASNTSATGSGSAAFNSANVIQQADRQGVGDIMGIVQGATGIASSLATCPAEGSLFLMADGALLPVEDIRVGDWIASRSETPGQVEAIHSVKAPILRICTENGFVTNNSYSHCFVTPDGFVLAAESLGKIVATADGASRVCSVEDDGTALVFSIETTGDHTYRADGVWAFGVGDVVSDEAAVRYMNSRALTIAA